MPSGFFQKRRYPPNLGSPPPPPLLARSYSIISREPAARRTCLTAEFHQTPFSSFLSPTRKGVNSVRGLHGTNWRTYANQLLLCLACRNAVCRIHNMQQRCIIFPPARPEARSPALTIKSTKYCTCSREVTCTQHNHVESRGVVLDVGTVIPLPNHSSAQVPD